MSGRILYKNLIRTLEPSSEHIGWSNTQRFTDEDPRLCAMATGTSGTGYNVIYDLGIARTATSAAVINHNMPEIGATFFLLQTGSVDDGATWDEVRVSAGNLQTYPGYTPSFAAVFSGSVTRRYWRFRFQQSTSATVELNVGQLCLFNANANLPTAPSAPRQFSCEDSTVMGRGLGGYEARHDAGVGKWRRQLRWKKEPGGIGAWTQVRDILRYARKHSEWGSEPICWVPHDAEKSNPTYDAHPCAYCVFEGLADSETLYVGGTRHYDVALRLRELTFDGLL